MSTHHHCHDKVRLTVECSFDERTYIKMLAAKKNMTISEFLLSSVRKVLPRSRSHHEPNPETTKALQESRKGRLKSYKTLDEFWKAMDIDPNA